MTTSRTRRARSGAVVLIVAALGAGLLTPGAQADPVRPPDGMPSQAFTDLSSGDPRVSSSQGGWADMPGGVESRPYVTSLTLVNGAQSTAVVTDGTATSAAPETGGVTTVVSPVNLCGAGVAPSSGRCYATPNRVSLTVGYQNGEGVGRNFAGPAVPVTQHVDADTVIDMTVALNTLGRSLRWTGLTGDLLSWQTHNLGQADATVHVRFRPASTPYVAQFPDGNGCTATPIFNCALPASDGEMLSASLLFSLDDTLDSALTGAVFGYQDAVAGFLQPGVDPQHPSLDIQVASTHVRSDGTPQRGTLRAFLPAAALLNLYGLRPEDAAATLSATRTGDAGTNSAPTYQVATPAVDGADGLWVTVRDISFSVPKYKLAGRLLPVRTSASVRRARTTITAGVRACNRTHRCRATVYRVTGARYATRATVVLRDRLVSAPALSLTVPSTQLGRGASYLLVVRKATGSALVTSARGTVRR